MGALKGKALRRAMATKDAHRLSNKIPLIQDTTELVTPEMAEKLLRANTNNRPINWNKVEEYRKMMEAGTWKFHAQGIILDAKGNILTGQKRLWAIVYSGIPQYLRISRGSPADTASLIDRGTPQSSRDLASRISDRRHSPVEVSIIRATMAAAGNSKPTTDQIADQLARNADILAVIMQQTKGIKKTKELLMILGAFIFLKNAGRLGELEQLGAKLSKKMDPIKVDACWNKGAAFILAMEKAVSVVDRGGND